MHAISMCHVGIKSPFQFRKHPDWSSVTDSMHRNMPLTLSDTLSGLDFCSDLSTRPATSEH